LRRRPACGDLLPALAAAGPQPGGGALVHRAGRGRESHDPREPGRAREDAARDEPARRHARERALPRGVGRLVLGLPHAARPEDGHAGRTSLWRQLRVPGRLRPHPHLGPAEHHQRSGDRAARQHDRGRLREPLPRRATDPRLADALAGLLAHGGRGSARDVHVPEEPAAGEPRRGTAPARGGREEVTNPGTRPTMSAHVWRFFRAGGFDQVKLETGADLLHLDELDLKLWVALACPTTGIEFDPVTAALIDTDKDGRIRAAELIAAIRWAGGMLADPDELVRGGDALALSAIADPALRASAKRICANLGNPEATRVTFADVTQADKSFAETLLNGDGVVIEASAGDEPTRLAIRDIAACMGTVPDRSGKPGIDLEKSEAFFAACVAFDAWHRAAEGDRAQVLPLGDATAAAADAVRSVRARAEDYFRRCRLAAFDPRALPLLEKKEDESLLASGTDGGVA